jgi:sterol desaturase/sphingolipid hydroxylase (fatty acid hydroxylase superfamily)
MDWLLPLLPSIALVALLTVMEAIARPAKTDWWRNVQAWVFGTFTGLSILPLFQAMHLPSLINGAALPFWVAFPAYLVIRDLAEYLYHRAEHSIPVLWAMHSLHHSDPEMSALTTQRHFWGDQLVKSASILPLTTMIIAPSPAAYSACVFVSLWNYVAHARLDVSFGPLSWLLNSPAYHRRHHSLLPEHYNSNFAALFPIFDVICGSYNRPEGFPPTGLARKPESFLELVVWPLRHESPAPEQGALASSSSRG